MGSEFIRVGSNDGSPGDPFIVSSLSSPGLTTRGKISLARSYSAHVVHRRQQHEKSKLVELTGSKRPLHPRSVQHPRKRTRKSARQNEMEAQEKARKYIEEFRPSFTHKFWHATHSQIHAWRGNSDPFDTAALRLGPAAHEHLAIAQRWGLFLQVSASRSARINREINQIWSFDINAALSDAPTLHAIMALGLQIQADVLSDVPQRREALKMVTMHKLAASAGLQDRLFNEGQTLQNFVLIEKLLGLAFFEQDFVAAQIHQEALSRLFPAQLAALSEARSMALGTSSVWVASILLRRTTLASRSFYPGSWSDALSDPVKQLIANHSDMLPDSSQIHPPSLPSDYPCSSHSSKLASVIRMHNESIFILSVSGVIPSALQDDIARYEIQTWMHRTKIALSTDHVEKIEALKSREQTPSVERQILTHRIMALLYTSMLLVRMTFYVATADCYQPACRELCIRSLRRQFDWGIAEVGKVNVRRKVNSLSGIWFYIIFVSSLTSHPCCNGEKSHQHEPGELCRPKGSSTHVTPDDFRFLKTSYENNVFSFETAKGVLQQFLYDPVFMDTHLSRVFDMANGK